MFSTRPPADFRIQRMRAADEKSNQMQAYVKVHAALQLSLPVVSSTLVPARAEFPLNLSTTDHRPRPVPASVLEDEGVRRRLGAQQQQHDSQEPVQAAVSARDEPIFPWIFTSQPRFPPIFPES